MTCRNCTSSQTNLLLSQRRVFTWFFMLMKKRTGAFVLTVRNGLSTTHTSASLMVSCRVTLRTIQPSATLISFSDAYVESTLTCQSWSHCTTLTFVLSKPMVVASFTAQVGELVQLVTCLVMPIPCTAWPCWLARRCRLITRGLSLSNHGYLHRIIW